MRINSDELDRVVDVVQRRADNLQAATTIRRGAGSLATRLRAERAGVLSSNQTAILGLLLRLGPMTPSELSIRTRSSLQSLTRTIASLEETGLMHRAVDPADRRQSILSIAQPGREALRTEMRPRDLWLAGVIEQELTETERDILVAAAKLLEKLALVDAAIAPVEVTE